MSARAPRCTVALLVGLTERLALTAARSGPGFVGCRFPPEVIAAAVCLRYGSSSRLHHWRLQDDGGVGDVDDQLKDCLVTRGRPRDACSARDRRGLPGAQADAGAAHRS